MSNTAYVWWSIAGSLILFLVIHFWWWECKHYPRHRIDWEHVYAMERDVYGQTFDHAGAPAYPTVQYNPFSVD